jgi:hypothetical protein
MVKFVIPQDFKFARVGEDAATETKEETETAEDLMCRDAEDEYDERTFPQYEIRDLRRIWCLVLCVNDEVPGTEKSVVGPTGHLERANAWSHLMAAVLYVGYIIGRRFTPMGKLSMLSNTLAIASYGVFVFMFLSSTIYHVHSPHRYWSAVTRLLDFMGIYSGIAAGTMSDLAIVTINLKNVDFRAIADVWIGAFLMVGFFVFRRTQLSISETRLTYMPQKCSLGFARSQNVDLEHSSLRSAGGVALSFTWIVTIPVAFANLEQDCAWMFAVSRFIGTAILLSGMALDNAFIWPDTAFTDTSKPRRCACYSQRRGCGGGWVFSAHALWHMVALLSTVVATVGTEYSIINSDILRNTAMSNATSA